MASEAATEVRAQRTRKPASAVYRHAGLDHQRLFSQRHSELDESPASHARQRQTRTPFTIVHAGRATGGRVVTTAPLGPAHPARTTPRAQTTALASLATLSVARISSNPANILVMFHTSMAVAVSIPSQPGHVLAGLALHIGQLLRTRRIGGILNVPSSNGFFG